jgi:hypothetical protein
MKQFVFFLVLVLAMIPLRVSGEDIHQCKEGTILINDFTLDLDITFRFSSPFHISLHHDNRAVVTHVLCQDDSIILYGFTDGNTDTYYDAYILVLDYEGNVVFEQVLDYGYEEDVKSVNVVDSIIYVTLLLSKEDPIRERELTYDHNIIIGYDYRYQVVYEEEFHGEIMKVEETNSLLLVYEDLKQVAFALDSSFNKYVESDILAIMPNYQGRFEVYFINQATLNGEEVENGIVLDYPGYYTLSYNDIEYPFTLDPEIRGVEDLTSYSEPVTIYFSAGNASLNGDLFLSGEQVAEPGNYSLEISGVNGYVKTINFTITSAVSGVIDGGIYKEAIEIIYQGEGVLNNNPVTSPLLIDEAGTYVLTIRGKDGYSEHYEFEYIEEEDAFVLRDFIGKVDIYVFGLVVIVALFVLKKK